MSFYQEDTFSTATSIGYLVRRIHQLGGMLLEPIFAEEDLTAAQWSTMVSIYLGEATTCATLSREVGHDKGAMTRIIDQLEARGFIVRERDASDRRIVNLTTTPEGREVGQRVKRKVLALWNEWLGDMEAAEINHLIATLSGLKLKLDKLVYPDPAE